tara:strand:+ start:223 stop:636 length:414 start_codon:yes stop_codon:yes gene_type:complete
MNKDADSGENLAQEDPPKPVVAEEPKKEEKKVEPKKLADKKETPKPATTTVTAKEKKKEDKKKEEKTALPEKKEEEDIPMDAAAIKAYSSVIADAAEDSAPATPVIYTETMVDEPTQRQTAPVGVDPMGSMIQNEIS